MTSSENVAQTNTSSQEIVQETTYSQSRLLDRLIVLLDLKNDAALARVLEVAPPVVSKVRHNRLPISAALLIRMHEVTGLAIADLRKIMGDRRAKFRVGGGKSYMKK